MSVSGPRIAVAAVGFDLGETLYHFDSCPLDLVERLRTAAAAVRRRSGPPPAQVARLQERAAGDGGVRRRAGAGAARALVDLLSAADHEAGPRLETAIDRSFGWVRRRLVAYPDAVPTLAALKARGFLIGALTNVPFGTPRRTVRKDLVRLGLAPSIDGLVTSVDAGVRKPCREAFAWVAATLSVEPGEMAFVGNLPSDVVGAAACGCVPILLDRTGASGDYGQAATVENVGELLTVLALENGGRAGGPGRGGAAIV